MTSKPYTFRVQRAFVHLIISHWIINFGIALQFQREGVKNHRQQFIILWKSGRSDPIHRYYLLVWNWSALGWLLRILYWQCNADGENHANQSDNIHNLAKDKAQINVREVIAVILCTQDNPIRTNISVSLDTAQKIYIMNLTQHKSEMSDNVEKQVDKWLVWIMA